MGFLGLATVLPFWMGLLPLGAAQGPLSQRGEQAPWGQEQPAGIAEVFEPRPEGGSSPKDADQKKSTLKDMNL